MKRSAVLLLVICLLALASCAPDYSYSAPEVSDIPDSALLEASFVSEYYSSLGTSGIKNLTEGEPIRRLVGATGSILVANTPTRVLFSHNEEKYIFNIYAYDKLTGQFSYACPDVMCDHSSCLWAPSGAQVYYGRKHIYFLLDDQIYITDAEGNGAEKISLPLDCELLYENEDGVYYALTETSDGENEYSLHFHKFSGGKDETLYTTAESVIYYVMNDRVFLHKVAILTLYELMPDGESLKEFATDVTFPRIFSGDFYDYNYDTGELLRLTDTGRETVCVIKDAEDIWISGGYVYYFGRDEEYISSHSDDKDMQTYLTKYNYTCGNIYRVSLQGGKTELVYHGEHDGKPDLIKFIVADGEMLYAELSDYKNFDNNLGGERGGTRFVIIDTSCGKHFELENMT